MEMEACEGEVSAGWEAEGRLPKLRSESGEDLGYLLLSIGSTLK